MSKNICYTCDASGEKISDPNCAVSVSVEINNNLLEYIEFDLSPKSASKFIKYLCSTILEEKGISELKMFLKQNSIAFRKETLTSPYE